MNKGDRVEASAPPTTTPAACGTGVNVVADKDLVFEHVIDELWPTGRPSIVVRVEAGRIVAINGKTR